MSDRYGPLIFFTFASLGRGRIDHRDDAVDAIGREATELRVPAHHRLVGRLVHAVDAVARHVALDPLDLRAHAAEHAARLLRNGLEVGRGQLAGAWDVSFDHEL